MGETCKPGVWTLSLTILNRIYASFVLAVQLKDNRSMSFIGLQKLLQIYAIFVMSHSALFLSLRHQAFLGHPPRLILRPAHCFYRERIAQKQ